MNTRLLIMIAVKSVFEKNIHNVKHVYESNLSIALTKNK